MTGGGKVKEHSLYWVWRDMRRRCNHSNHPDYPRYGGRGIRVCARWDRSFWDFVADIGPRPFGKFPSGRAKYSLERENNNGNYTPTNCVWATGEQQSRNTGRNRLLRFNGERLPVCEWAERLGVSPCTIVKRLRLGWTVKKALATPVRKKRQGLTFAGRKLSVAEWARRRKMKATTIHTRLSCGWSAEDALLTPVGHQKGARR